jgi:pimeloyl-ACP methyl ester carboxylesterase
MLPFSEYGSGETTLFLMPFLGGSQREWTESVALLSKHYRCVTVDLPGFGEAAEIPGYSVSEMADAVIEIISSLKPERYLLIGHSMAGKVAAVVTRKLIDSGSIHTPIGMILIAPSPPGPEPMSDSKRKHMLESLGTSTGLSTEEERTQAEKYIRDNAVRPIATEILERTVDDVLRMNRAAWVAWLESGSKEDWSSRVGVLGLPTLILAGEHDSALGGDAQREHTLPHFTGGYLIVVDCGHLIPIDAPAEMVAFISNYLKVF